VVIASIQYLDDSDVHLLLGQSWPAQDTQLYVVWTDPNAEIKNWSELRAAHPEVAIEFRPVFNAVESAEAYEGFGIRVNKATGAVTIAVGPPPNPAPSNFLLEAVVKKNGDGDPGTPVPNAFTRIHVHGSVTRIWATPSRLSVRQVPNLNRTNYQFVIRAQFDDGSVADISHSGRTQPPKPADADVIDAQHVVHIPPGMGAGSPSRFVTFTTTPEWNSRSAQAEIRVLDSWDAEPQMPVAEWIDGPAAVLDGSVKPETMPNVLFIASGYLESDRVAFERTTHTIVQEMRTNRQLSPYGHLSNAMSFWRLFVPAAEAGVSVRCEVFSIMKEGARFALPVPVPKPPPKTGAWTLNTLVYMAGLPVPADLALVRDRTTNLPPPSVEILENLKLTQLDFLRLLDKWAQTIPLNPPFNLTTIEPKLLREWIGLANRTFIDEVDNFPALAIGVPPNATFDETGTIEFHDFRGGPMDFIDRLHERVEFFRHVAAAARGGAARITLGTPAPRNEVGSLWAEDRPEFAYLNTRLTVTFGNMPIGRSSRFFGRSQSTGEGLFTRPTLREPPDITREIPGLPVTRDLADPTRNALLLALPPLNSSDISPETWEVIAHEITHGFGLGDEYVETPTRFTGNEEAFNISANLSTTASFLRPDNSVAFERIKWNWHRIAKAAVITRPIENKLNGLFHVFISKRSRIIFSAGEHVLLRKRDSHEVISRKSVTSAVEFVVKSMVGQNLDDPADHDNATIEITAAPGVDLSPFGPGSLIFVPVPAPDTIRTAQRPYLTLVSPAAERIMTAIGGTMSGKECNAEAQAGRALAAVHTPDLPASELLAQVSVTVLPGLVGAYFGGGRDACGVAHPAGSCMMRRHRLTRSPQLAFARFCPVCQYALVDRIDPEQHGRLDQDYGKIFTL
jgi:hypothetical protein